MHKTGTPSHAQRKMLASIPQKGTEVSEVRNGVIRSLLLKAHCGSSAVQEIGEGGETGRSETCLDTMYVV